MSERQSIYQNPLVVFPGCITTSVQTEASLTLLYFIKIKNESPMKTSLLLKIYLQKLSQDEMLVFENK